jgi:hypothetical protein
LNSKLNREILEFERSVAAGTHRLLGDSEVYEPISELEVEAHVHILGGNNMPSVVNESREERRRKLLEATMLRLQREEEELENNCGTGHSL